MRILVTGATGFIGESLVEELIKQEYKIRCLVRDLKKIKKLKNIETWIGDITKPETLEGITKDIDMIIHLAAIGKINAVSKKHYQLYYEVNVQGTENLLKECRYSKIKKFIYVSSLASMGILKDKGNISSHYKSKPKLPYEITKFKSEKICEKYAKKFNMLLIILRPCMVYDWNGKGHGDVDIIRKMLKIGLVVLPGTGNNLVNIIHRKTLVSKISDILKEKKNEKLQILIEETISLRELVEKTAKHYKIKNYLIIFLPKKLIYPLTAIMELFAKKLSFVPLINTTRLNSMY